MPSSTKRPKPKPSQMAGKAPAAKKEETQQASTTVISKVTQPAPKTQPAKSPPAALSQSNKRDQKRDEISRKLEERRLQRERQQRSRLLKRWLTIGGSALLVMGIIAFIVVKIVTSPPQPPYVTGAPIDGITCDQGEHSQTHYHVQLQMYINGQAQPFPSDAGRQDSSCFYWLHTHNSDGVIHIEAPADGTYTVKQFFDIWGQTISPTNLLGHKTNAQNKLTVYVFSPSDPNAQDDANGNLTVTPPSNLAPYTGDPTKIKLTPHEVIYLEYGTPDQAVTPQAYTFTGSL